MQRPVQHTQNPPTCRLLGSTYILLLLSIFYMNISVLLTYWLLSLIMAIVLVILMESVHKYFTFLIFMLSVFLAANLGYFVYLVFENRIVDARPMKNVSHVVSLLCFPLIIYISRQLHLMKTVW